MAAHLLQSTLFAALAALLSLALRGNRARTRYWLWMAASVKFLVPFSVLVSLSSYIPRPSERALPPPQLAFVMTAEARPQVQLPPPQPQGRDWPSTTLYAVWLGVSAVIAARWYLRWRRLARVVRNASPVPDAVAQALARVAAGVPIRAFASPATLEPGVFGMFRPVLLVPAGMEQRLSGEQLQAVLAHEFCHVVRRDNLAAALHMFVESLFWFHPVVWWLGARLVEERELACDEAVLQLGSDPEVYAQSILRVCEFCLESPLPCVSGITGADLTRRIESIMTGRLAKPLQRGKKLLIGAFVAAAAAGPIAFGLLHPTHIRAQEKTAAPLYFEAASVKPSSQAWLQIAPQRSGGRIRWTTDLTYLLGYAYRLQPWRISGPIPGSDNIYAVDATMPASASDDQVRLMFQSLLTDRFKMVAHRVTKDVDGWALTVAKNGPKIKAVKPEDPPAPLPRWFQDNGTDPAVLEGKVVATIQDSSVGAIAGRRATMLQLTEALQRVLRLAVVDETGLSGSFYFALEFAREDHPTDSDAASLPVALQQTLGLKLEKRKTPVEMLVVDRIEKTPTEN